jgi:hypothetical protein
MQSTSIPGIHLRYELRCCLFLYASGNHHYVGSGWKDSNGKSIHTTAVLLSRVLAVANQ